MFAPIRAYHIDLNTGVYTDEGEWSEGKNPLKFIMHHRAKLNIFPNLDGCVGALCGLLELDKEQLKQLKEQDEIHIDYHGVRYLLKYYKGRHFCIEFADGRNGFANFMCASLYNEDFGTIEDAHHKNYCVDRAKQALAIGEQVKDAYEALGWKPSKVSPVSALRDKVHIEMPDLANAPEEVLKWALKCCNGGWQEAFTLGHWTGEDGDEVFDFDLVSAYPHIASKLMHLDYGHWVHTPEWQKDAEYGYCMVRVDVKSEVSPVAWWRAKEQHKFTPKGQWERPMSIQKIRFLRKWDLADVVILDGYWWIPDKEVYLFEDIAQDLFEKKQSSNGLKREVVKKALNGYLYGRWLQYNAKERLFSDAFNPIFAEQVLNGTKMRIVSTCLRNGVRPLHIAVDGFLSDKPIPTPHPDRMGSWKLAYSGRCVIAGTATVGKDMPKPREFAINYDKLLEAVEGDPSADEWTITKMHVIGVDDAVAHGKPIGELEEMRKVIGLGDTKRTYHPIPLDGEDLLSGKKYLSKPWSVDVLEPLVASREDLFDQDWWKILHGEEVIQDE